MTRAIGLLGLMMLLATALAVPSFASAADWKENGTEITDFSPHWLKNGGSLTSSTNLTLEGTYNFTSAAGGINCSATAGATINPGSSGSLSNLTLSKCTVNGGFNGCTLTSATSSGLPDFTASTGGVVKIVGANSAYKLSGPWWCPKEVNVVNAPGESLTATPDNSGKISSLTLSGNAKLALEGKSAGSATMNGTLTVKPAATYGVAAAPTVALKGSLSHTTGVGGIQCSVNGSLSLQAAGAGQIPAFSWSCVKTGGGFWYAGCGNITSVTSNSLPWAVQDEGTTVKISGVSFTVQMETCSVSYNGTLTGTPDKAGAISNLKLSGALNSGGGNYTWEGGLDWTPAGWYGL